MSGSQPSTSVVEYGWVAGPVKAGLRPPPPAADGLDRACHPAFVCHQAFDGEERLKPGQIACHFFHDATFGIYPGRRSQGVGVQTPPLREWTHAAPVILLPAIPPAMAVLPSADSATEWPCLARPIVSVPTSLLPCWFHTVPRRLKTHAAPMYQLS
jgi:hypothetical protein